MRPDTRVFQQLPISSNWRTTDNIANYRSIMIEHEQGYFMQSAMFWEECLSDDRIAAVVDTRIDGMLSADLEFVPVDDRRKSKGLAEELGGSDRTQDDGLWLRMMDPDTAKELLKWYIGLGFCYGPIVWDSKDGKWFPRVIPWHPRFVRWDWSNWKYTVTAWNEPLVYLPRTDEDPRSDGKWFVMGGYRSWMHGLVRSLGVPYLDRTWNQRDAARRSEKYGMGIVKGLTPPGNDTEDKQRFGSALRNLGAEPTIICPQGENGNPGFDVEVVETKGEGWQIFGDREKGLNTNIAVRVLGQNLTTEVSGTGSLAAGKVHEMVRGDIKRADSRFYTKVRDQVLTWWTGYNFGDPELAPYPRAQITQPADPLQDAQELLTVVTAIEKAPPELDTTAILEAHGFPVLEGDALAARLERMRALRPVAPQAPGTPPGTAGTPPAEGDATAQATSSTVDLGAARQLSELSVSLSAGTGATRRRAKYQNVQAEIAARKASKTLRPFIQRVLAAIDSPGEETDRDAWFAKLRKEIVAEGRRRGADVDGLAKLVAQVNTLARLHGRESALASVLK
jgi:hypothetical protein